MGSVDRRVKGKPKVSVRRKGEGRTSPTGVRGSTLNIGVTSSRTSLSNVNFLKGTFDSFTTFSGVKVETVGVEREDYN